LNSLTDRITARLLLKLSVVLPAELTQKLAFNVRCTQRPHVHTYSTTSRQQHQTQIYFSTETVIRQVKNTKFGAENPLFGKFGGKIKL